MKKASAWVDGGSRGNPGEAGYGVYFKETGREPEEIYGYLGGPHTNNYAEYQGLLAALRHARARGIEELKIHSDSELLVRQIQGRYRVKNEALRRLHAEALTLIRGFRKFIIAHVPREKNKDADRLANTALDLRSSNVAPAAKAIRASLFE